MDGDKKLTIPGHIGPVKAVCWLKRGELIFCISIRLLKITINVYLFIEAQSSFVSASHDQSAMIWEWDSVANSVQCVCVCKEHERSVECVDVNGDGTKVTIAPVIG